MSLQLSQLEMPGDERVCGLVENGIVAEVVEAEVVLEDKVWHGWAVW